MIGWLTDTHTPTILQVGDRSSSPPPPNRAQPLHSTPSQPQPQPTHTHISTIQVGDRSSEFYPDVNEVRQEGSYIYEEFVETQGTDVKARAYLVDMGLGVC